MDDNQNSRERTLVEYCSLLPNHRKANKELKMLKLTVGLLNSMVLCGERHSESSTKIVEDSIEILKNVRVFSGA